MNTVLWFKRDCRLADHRPLTEAVQAGDAVLPMHLLEPEIWQAPDASQRQLGFLLESLDDLEAELQAAGSHLLRLAGEAVATLTALHQRWPFQRLLSHEETGNALTYARDRAVAAWCRAHGVQWIESRQFAVQRGPLDRDDWEALWRREMSQPLYPAPRQLRYPDGAPRPDRRRWAPQLATWIVPGSEAPQRQRGGRTEGLRVLHQFLQVRGVNYRASLSSPLRAGQGNSRLSPYLTWGCLSLREVLAALAERRLQCAGDPLWTEALTAFKSRLHWHCHFIQKFEQEPELETQPMNRAFLGLRHEADRFEDLPPEDQHKLSAWCAGATGYPLIDACMAMLQDTGWINFRMRAMLISFATHHLWLHWQLPARHLARLFVDYEPGIHYPQIQMQSGVTGINALRVYNPVKQQRDQDPQGVFVKRWLPALRPVSVAWLAEPWKRPRTLQEQEGCVIGRDYPAPVIDHQEAARQAKAKLHAWRRQPEARSEARAVFLKHGSRQTPRQRLARQRAAAALLPAPQLSLLLSDEQPL